MKTVSFLFAILLAGICQAQTKMTLTINGQKVGNAVINQKVTASGGIEQNIQMNIDTPTGKVQFSHYAVCDKAGRPIRQSNISTGGPFAKNTTITYGAKSITVTVNTGGKSTTKAVPIPKGNINDTSNLWFAVTHPKIGMQASYLDYDVDTGKWETETAKYLGDEKVTGTNKTGHRIHHDKGDMWMDDKGLPIRMEMNEGGIQMVMVRQ